MEAIRQVESEQFLGLGCRRRQWITKDRTTRGQGLQNTLCNSGRVSWSCQSVESRLSLCVFPLLFSGHTEGHFLSQSCHSSGQAQTFEQQHHVLHTADCSFRALKGWAFLIKHRKLGTFVFQIEFCLCVNWAKPLIKSLNLNFLIRDVEVVGRYDRNGAGFRKSLWNQLKVHLCVWHRMHQSVPLGSPRPFVSILGGGKEGGTAPHCHTQLPEEFP